MSIRSRRFMLQGLATAGPAPLAVCVPRPSSGQQELVAPAPGAVPRHRVHPLRPSSTDHRWLPTQLCFDNPHDVYNDGLVAVRYDRADAGGEEVGGGASCA